MNTLVRPWNEQGCPVCRAEWSSSSRLALKHLGTSNELHARLYLCEACGAHWEELERYVRQVSAAEAAELQRHGSFAAA
jgi:hypothetical protein